MCHSCAKFTQGCEFCFSSYTNLSYGSYLTCLLHTYPPPPIELSNSKALLSFRIRLGPLVVCLTVSKYSKEVHHVWHSSHKITSEEKLHAKLNSFLRNLPRSPALWESLRTVEAANHSVALKTFSHHEEQRTNLRTNFPPERRPCETFELKQILFSPVPFCVCPWRAQNWTRMRYRSHKGPTSQANFWTILYTGASFWASLLPPPETTSRGGGGPPGNLGGPPTPDGCLRCSCRPLRWVLGLMGGGAPDRS